MNLENEITPGNKRAGAATPVGRMFDGRSVFITGASGFIGRVLLEKLLRSYTGIKWIYILMRSKKDQTPSERLHSQVLNAPIFDAIRAKPEGSKLFDKISVIAGDIGEPDLGMSREDMQLLLHDESLSVVFHCAATIKFDEPLRVSVKLNLVATKAIIELCRRLPSLVSLCHVSTAYVNSDIKSNQPIGEELYPINRKPVHVIKMAEVLDEDLMQMLKSKLVGQRPNTYTYTKALAEHMIVEEASDLPVAIVRPSIVVSAWKQPLPGWIDNLNGPTGLILAIGKGLCRTLYMNPDVIADMIPVDIVVNTIIASAFYAARESNKVNSNGDLVVPSKDTSPTGERNTSNDELDSIKGSNGLPSLTGKDQRGLDRGKQSVNRPPPIIHCNSGQIKPLTCGEMYQWFFPVVRRYPSCEVLRYPNGTMKTNYYHDLVARIFVHYLPALILDIICIVVGKSADQLTLYSKLHGAIAALNHFLTQNYKFRTNNMKIVHASLSEADQKDLYVDIDTLDWYEFWSDYTLGVR